MTKPSDPMAAFVAADMGVWSWDPSQDQVWGDPRFATLMGLDPAGTLWSLQTVFPADVHDALAQSNEGAKPVDLSFCIATKPARWLALRGALMGADPAIVTGVLWDVTVFKTQEARLTLLASEMDHRVKNAFAVIQALINLGTRASPENAAFAASLKAQVAAMATAHSASSHIARKTDALHDPVPLQDLLGHALGPWRGRHHISEVDTDALYLALQEIAPMSMLIHELMTNAAKYGGLSAPDGQVTVRAVSDKGGARVMIWEEACKAPVPRQTEGPPGFGAVLVEHCAKTLDARLERKISAPGLKVTLRLPPLLR